MGFKESITADTSLESLLDYKKLCSDIDKNFSKTKEQLEERIKIIDKELTRGLSPEAFVHGNRSELNSTAKITKKVLEGSLDVINKLKNCVSNRGMFQRRMELWALKGKLEEKISELSSTISIIEGAALEANVSPSDINTGYDSNKSLKTNYESVLEKVKAELEKLPLF